MNTDFDVLVIGCGISGAVVAAKLADKGYRVLILERRDHIAGNMYDYIDEHGVLIHKYGPHIFHTSDDEVYELMCHYGEWDDFTLVCGAEINGICTPTPFNFKTIDDFYSAEDAAKLKEHILKAFPGRDTATVVEVLSCEDPVVSGYAQFLFDNDYSLYTAKQWGVPADRIDPSVLKRVPLRLSYEEGYFSDKYEMMPRKSYTEFFRKLLDSENITVKLNTDAFSHITVSADKTKLLYDGEELTVPVVYSGALDELFGCEFGALPYRSLRFEWKYEETERLQKYPVVAYPQAEGFTRIVEYKQLPVQDVKGTTYEVEYPLPYKSGTRQEPYYPVLTEDSIRQYERYSELAKQIPVLYPCGRLADFKYYNMDQAVKNALDIAGKVADRLN